MNEKSKTLKMGKKEYRLVFSTQALIDITERFGGVEEMAGELEKKGVRAIPEYAWLIALLINQGIEIDNEDNGEEAPLIAEKTVLLYLSPAALIEAQHVLMDAIKAGMGREIEGNEEDEDEVLSQIKNDEGVAE